MSADLRGRASTPLDAAPVRALIDSRFPQWSALPVARVESDGTDNLMYRLGAELVVRLPRSDEAAAMLRKEVRWLPALAPGLPLAVPVPVGLGGPAAGFPHPWAVYRWLPGSPVTGGRLGEARTTAELARFIDALQRTDPYGGPAPGPHNGFRGEPLAARDEETRAAIAAVADLRGTGRPGEPHRGGYDAGALTAAWEAALRAPCRTERPVWVHGDLHAGNLLTVGGRLSAVIDFGCLAVGDPACDAMAGWTLLRAGERERFRTRLGCADEDTWARARGWALSTGVVHLAAHAGAGPSATRGARRQIAEVLADHAARA
ncbi:aminoglycoside phosphotransferase family protein [Streptomyces anulatus]|uniref:aminoglycoside phosphotransferase family protein n=1 Tax=Streptomyces anulatus TaxID=1892 RepID=UPI0036383F4E